MTTLCSTPLDLSTPTEAVFLHPKLLSPPHVWVSQYASPAGRGKGMDQGRVRTNYSTIPNTYHGGSSSSESSEDEEMPGVGDAAPTVGRGMGTEHATLPRCHGLLTSLPPWTGPKNFSLLQQYVRTHFSGDWAAYTAFVHWADSQRLEFPIEPVHVETWLSMKIPSIRFGDPPGAPLAALAMKGGRLGDLGNSNMCNKTCIDLSVAPHISPSNGAPPRTFAPGRILFPTGSSGNHDIWSFLPSCNLTPHWVAVAWSVDAAIALQEVDEAAIETARVAQRKALKEKFEEAAHQKLVPQGKGVTWSPASVNSVPAPDEGKGVTWTQASGTRDLLRMLTWKMSPLLHCYQPGRGDPLFAQLHG